MMNPNPEEEPIIKPIPITNQSNLEKRIDIFVSGADLTLERELAAPPAALRFNPANLPKAECWVEIPTRVADALRNMIAHNDLPIDPLTIDWIEAEVADHNGVPAEMIAADDCIIRTGKSWHYIAESAKAFTGFTFYPSGK